MVPRPEGTLGRRSVPQHTSRHDGVGCQHAQPSVRRAPSPVRLHHQHRQGRQGDEQRRRAGPATALRHRHRAARRPAGAPRGRCRRTPGRRCRTRRASPPPPGPRPVPVTRDRRQVGHHRHHPVGRVPRFGPADRFRTRRTMPERTGRSRTRSGRRSSASSHQNVESGSSSPLHSAGWATWRRLRSPTMCGDAVVARIGQEPPVELAVVGPLALLGQLGTHEEELAPGVAPLPGQEASEVGEAAAIRRPASCRSASPCRGRPRRG